MPNWDLIVRQLTEATCFAALDLCQGYWQWTLEKASQECQSFICPDGGYTPTRVLNGQINTFAYLQGAFAEMCDPHLKQNLVRWLDDILVDGNTS